MHSVLLAWSTEATPETLTEVLAPLYIPLRGIGSAPSRFGTVLLSTYLKSVR
jgi:hypothetical protein